MYREQAMRTASAAADALRRESAKMANDLIFGDLDARRAEEEARIEVRLLPIRPRSRGERRSLRTFPVVTLHPRFPFNV
jgi:hypothetical protein